MSPDRGTPPGADGDEDRPAQARRITPAEGSVGGRQGIRWVAAEEESGVDGGEDRPAQARRVTPAEGSVGGRQGIRWVAAEEESGVDGGEDRPAQARRIAPAEGSVGGRQGIRWLAADGGADAGSEEAGSPAAGSAAEAAAAGSAGGSTGPNPVGAAADPSSSEPADATLEDGANTRVAAPTESASSRVPEPPAPPAPVGPGERPSGASTEPTSAGRDEDGLGGRIRPYALTGGRTRSAEDLPLETLVIRTTSGTVALAGAQMERRRILDLCGRPLSIAEISAYVGVHLGVARVLVGDMKGEGLLDVHRPRPVGDRPDIKLLERVLDGLQAL